MTEDRLATGTEFRTDDLGLAAFLTLSGHTHQRLQRRGRRTVIWVFDRADGLADLVDNFRRGVAAVEPLAYQRVLTETRRDMFDFLDAAA